MSDLSPSGSQQARGTGGAPAIRRWTLKRQLAAAMVALMIVAVVVIGSISVGTQGQSLLNRLDDQLRIALDLNAITVVDAQSQGLLGGAATSPNGAETPPPAADQPDPGGLPPGEVGPRPQFGSLSVVILNGEPLVARTVDEGTGAVVELTEDQIAQLEAEAGTAADPSQVELVGSGSYRVAAEHITGPEHSATVIAGQSLAEVTRTVRDQILVFTLVAVATITVTLLLALWLIRLGLRPLNRLVGVASEVSRTPLSSGAVTLSERVPRPDASPGTEIGEVGQALNTMLDHLESSLQARHDGEEQLRRFIADASHELRTPLASIRGYADLASRSRDQLPDSVGHALGRIGSESVRMTGMVEDLLLLARLDSGAALHEEPVALAGVVVDACSDAQVTGPEHQWVIELDDDAAGITVDGDADRLHQVMTNLLNNARDHTPAGTAITVRLGTRGASEAVVEVEDNGPGIPEELQGRIFDRFVRGDDSRSRSAGSTGLGMAIVDAIVKAHRGQVELGSSPGMTRITVILPLQPEPVSPPQAP